MPHRRGRTDEALEAVSGSLTLLVNLLMTWTTQQIQAASERLAAKGTSAPEGVLGHVAPARLWNVNLRGTLCWPIDDYADRILSIPRSAHVLPLQRRACITAVPEIGEVLEHVSAG